MLSYFHRLIKYIERKYYEILYRKCFLSKGKHVIICKPQLIEGNKSIIIEDDVKISKGVWLASMNLTGATPMLKIGRQTRIGHYNHIYCTSSIVIEDNVLTADSVYISDNAHGYEDTEFPIWQQPIRQLSQVVIGEGSWLGEHVCIIGASIGKHCVIGANSVVTKDIPDYCIAVGAPARIIKVYNQETMCWEKFNQI